MTDARAMFGGEAPETVGRPGKVPLRVFVHLRGDTVVLRLGGYDTGDDPKARRQFYDLLPRGED